MVKLSVMKRVLCNLSCKILLYCILVSSNACTTIYTKSDLDKAEGKFSGISQILKDHPLTQILMVHGMGSHKIGYSGFIRNGIVENLRLKPHKNRGTIILCNSSDEKCIRHAFLKSWDYIDQAENKTLRFYELTWAPVTAPIKQTSLAEDQEIAEYRVPLNNALKEFINDSLSDPILYIGSYKENIQDIVMQTLCTIILDTHDELTNDPAPCSQHEKLVRAKSSDRGVAFISHSLGSKIIYDALIQLGSGGLPSLHSTGSSAGKSDDRDSRRGDRLLADVTTHFLSKIYSVYMMANQIPFLEMASASGVVSAFDKQNAILNLLNLRSSREPLQIIAFTDPNDLLSYPLPPHYCSSLSNPHSAICVNVFCNNNTDIIFGQFSNPITAHTGYYKNDKVLDYISCGSLSKRSPLCDVVDDRTQVVEDF